MTNDYSTACCAAFERWQERQGEEDQSSRCRPPGIRRASIRELQIDEPQLNVKPPRTTSGGSGQRPLTIGWGYGGGKASPIGGSQLAG